MANKFQEIAFTDAVKAAQDHYGSRRHFEKLEHRADSNFEVGDAEADFIESRDGFYLATASNDGQPYIQFRGGRRGFLKVLDGQTLGYADFRGNLQYISVGNASENKKVALFLMDYPNRRRLKIIGEIEFRDAADNPELIEKLADPSYDAKVERAAVIHVKGLEWNCPQHITPRYTIDEVQAMDEPLYEHIEKLEREFAAIKGEEGETIS